MNKATIILGLFFAAILSYFIWQGINFYQSPNKPVTISKTVQEECNGTWEYLEDWDKYGNDLGKPVCIVK